MPQVLVPGIPDPLVVLSLYQEAHHRLIADQLAEELGRFLAARVESVTDQPGKSSWNRKIACCSLAGE